MREIRPWGSVRGVSGNRYPYRDPAERRGQAIRVMIDLVNWQQEEPTGYGGGRQLSLDGTSRVTGDSHARICERLGVKIPWAPRRCRATGIPTATNGR